MPDIDNPKIKEVCKDFILTTEQCKQVVATLTQELRKGLGKDTNKTATVKCFLTYIHAVPTGEERGEFLALDLGGTNFRVLMINILSDVDVRMTAETYAIPADLLTGPGSKLFDFIARSLVDFVKNQNIADKELALGFTFSFPCRQEDLKSGTLVAWTKGFNCTGVVGKDVVQLLTEALQRNNATNIRAVALLNDTTGTLMSCAWLNRNCKIGLIVGTGSNACYMEKMENVELMRGPACDKSHIIINSEWGAFGDNGVLDFIRTQIDKDVDEITINKSKQTFEKMISGMYLGELVRRIITKLVGDGDLFGGELPAELNKPWSFSTKDISTVESDPAGVYDKCRELLVGFGRASPSDDDCAAVRYICEIISTRSATLVACGLVTFLNKMNEKEVVIGIDGSVYRYHPAYHDRLTEKMSKIINPGINFELMLSEDGSGRGAALVAAVASSTPSVPKVCSCKRKKCRHNKV